MANIYDMADTWNDGGTTFTAIKMTVTESAAASGSLLLDLQHGASGSETSVFNVNSAGDLKLGKGNVAVATFYAGDEDIFRAYGSGYGVQSFRVLTSGGLSLQSDVVLTRKTGANLRLGAADASAAVAQTLSVQSVATGTSPTDDNKLGADFTIQGSAGTGSGTGGSIIFQVAPAGTSGSTQNSFVDALTIGSDKLITIAANSSNVARIAAADRGTVMTFYDTTFGSQPLYLTMPGGLALNNDTSAFIMGQQSDIQLHRDAGDKLALRRGTTAQEFRVYKTTTGTVYKALLGDNNLIKISGEAFTDGAGSDTGTLTNAPAAGNPTKWIPIDDNGTTRYIPAW